MTFFERLFDSRSCFDGSMSVHILSLNGIVVAPVDSLDRGFAFAFNLAATTPELVGTSSSSCGSAKFFVSYSVLR